MALNLAETDLDTIAVTYSVARDATGMELCEPYTVSYSLEHDGLPLRIEIRPGAEWRRSMFVRVEGLQAGVTRFRQERAASLTGGDVRVRVDIAPTCLDAGLGQGEHCVDGQVLESPLWRIFDQGQFVQIGEKCRDAP